MPEMRLSFCMINWVCIVTLICSPSSLVAILQTTQQVLNDGLIYGAGERFYIDCVVILGAEAARRRFYAILPEADRRVDVLRLDL